LQNLKHLLALKCAYAQHFVILMNKHANFSMFGPVTWANE